MAAGTIIKAWTQGGTAYLAVRVAEPNGEAVEYQGSLPVTQLAGLSGAQQKAALVAAVKAARDLQANATVDLGLSGAVTV